MGAWATVHVTQTGTNTLNAEAIKSKANAGTLRVSIQNHTTTANNYINKEGKASTSFDASGLTTTWEVVKHGDGYALKNSDGKYIKDAARPVTFTEDISAALLFMPTDCEGNVEAIGNDYNSSQAVRWKLLSNSGTQMNTNGMNTSTTVMFNTGTGNWTCLFTYEVTSLDLSANKGYKLKLKDTDLYVKFSISGYVEDSAINATQLSSTGSIFNLGATGNGFTLKWRNEYMKTTGTVMSWNTGHGTDTDNSTWYIEPVEGESNTYYIKRPDTKYLGANSTSEGSYIYTDKASTGNVKWIFEETTVSDRMLENGYWPETSTAADPKYYTIKNTRCGKYAKYMGDAQKMALISDRLETTANAFWFEAVNESGLADDVLAVKIHNEDAGKCVAATNSFTDAGITWYLKADVYTGTASVAINSSATNWTNDSYGWNNESGQNNFIATYRSTDVGSAWWIESLSNEDLTEMRAIYRHQIDILKEEAIAKVQSSSILFGDDETSGTAAYTALAAINGVSRENTEAALNDAVTAINNALNTMYATVNDTKIVFKNPVRNNKYMVVVDAVQLAGADAVDGRSEFKVNYNGSGFTIQNTVTGRYIANTPGTSQRVQLSTTPGEFSIKPSSVDNKFAFISASPANSQHNSLHLDGSSNVVAWEAYPDNASTWVIESSTLTNEQLAAGVTAVRDQALSKIQSSFNGLKNNVGSGLNQYVATEAYNNAASAIENASNAQEYEVLLAMQDTYQTAYNALAINQPADGSFIRVRSVKTGTTSGKGYINAETVAVSNHGNVLKVGDIGKSSVYYYKDGKLIAYNCGQYLIKNSSGGGFLSLGETGNNGASIVFGRGTKQQGTYYVTFDGRYLYAGDNATNIDAASSEENNGYNFWLEQVTSLPVTMNAVDNKYYGTINLPVAVTIPEGVYAYKAAVAGDVMTLTKVVENGVLAANTPVVLYSASEVTSLSISAEAGTGADDDAFRGTTAAITAPAGTNYVLSYSSTEGVGFYKYTGTVIPGFKAYFNDPSGSSVKGFAFSFEDVETAIRAIEDENNDLEIYDIAGRRVQQAQKGLYIVNGKKVMFK